MTPVSPPPAPSPLATSLTHFGRRRRGAEGALPRFASFARGEKPSDRWRIGTEHEKFVYALGDHHAPSYDEASGIRALLGELEQYGWAPVMEGGNVIALTGADGSISLEPAGQFELSGAISVANGVLGEAKGVATARAVSLTAPQRDVVGKTVAGPLESVLPSFAAATRLAIDRAAQSFEVRAPWSATASTASTSRRMSAACS